MLSRGTQPVNSEMRRRNRTVFRQLSSELSVAVVLPVAVFTVNKFCFVDDITADVGGMVTLHCFTTITTSATWSYQKITSHKPDDICNVKGNLMEGFRPPRFSLHRTDHQFHLIIANLSTSDSGFYTCTDHDGYGDKHVTRLIVLGNHYNVYFNSRVQFLLLLS